MPTLKAAAFITLSRVPVLKPVPYYHSPFLLKEWWRAPRKTGRHRVPSKHPCCLSGEVGLLDCRELDTVFSKIAWEPLPMTTCLPLQSAQGNGLHSRGQLSA